MKIGTQNDSNEGQQQFVERLKFPGIQCMNLVTKDTCVGCLDVSTNSIFGKTQMMLNMFPEQQEYVFEELVTEFFKTRTVEKYCTSGKPTCVHDRDVKKDDWPVLINLQEGDRKAKYNGRTGKVLEVDKTTRRGIVKLDSLPHEEVTSSKIVLPIANLLPPKRMDCHRIERFEGLKKGNFVNIMFMRFFLGQKK